LKLNQGVGIKRVPGFINVDYSPECSPDVVMNLDETPGSFDTDSVSHIILSHVLEHLGQTPSSFLSIMKELYRICKNEAVIDITVPHPVP
jgi:predicted SAM-dependent methyltransferase